MLVAQWEKNKISYNVLRVYFSCGMTQNQVSD